MFRTLLTATLATIFALAGCHHEPKPMVPKEGELPPLPPASGTPVGYLLDNAAQLKLDDGQIAKLKDIDNSLAARNDGIDTQLREIEKPEDEEEGEKPKKGAPPPKPKNMAPGAQQVHTTTDSGKLHAAKDANNKDALTKAFAILTADQQSAARKLLDDRGVAAPGGSAKPEASHEDDGVPLEQ